MAGRHGVSPQERKTHARTARGQRRSRTQRRDAVQPWRLWLLARVVLALVVLAACGWSALLVERGQGGIWPLIAIGAGVLSLLMIGLDVRARVRQRARLRTPALSPPASAPASAPAPAPAPDRPLPAPRRGAHQAHEAPPDQPIPARPFLPEPPPKPGRHSQRQ